MLITKVLWKVTDLFRVKMSVIDTPGADIEPHYRRSGRV
jgi:hypothetical protein